MKSYVYTYDNSRVLEEQTMKSNLTFLAVSAVLVGAIAVPAISLAQGKAKPKAPAAAAKLTYKKNIGSVITKECAGCHTGPSAKEGIDLSTYAGIMKGNKEGKIVVAGNPAKSMLCGVLHGKPKLMPPGGKGLDAKTIALIELWVKQGAKEK